MSNSFSTSIFRSVDWLVCKAAGITFDTIQHFNKKNPNPSVTPQWSDKPLLKSWEKTKPTLGYPRQTDSLCPACVKEARESIIAGKKDFPRTTTKACTSMALRTFVTAAVLFLPSTSPIAAT
jgi:hypothetical protein